MTPLVRGHKNIMFRPSKHILVDSQEFSYKTHVVDQSQVISKIALPKHALLRLDISSCLEQWHSKVVQDPSVLAVAGI